MSMTTESVVPGLTPEQAWKIQMRLLGRTCDHEAYAALAAIARLHKVESRTGA